MGVVPLVCSSRCSVGTAVSCGDAAGAVSFGVISTSVSAARGVVGCDARRGENEEKVITSVTSS